MMPILQVGPLAIQLPGLLLLLGLWLGLSLAERHAPRHRLNSNTLYNLVFSGLVAGIIGARLAYIIRFPEVFSQTPRSIFSLNPGLLDLWGGIAVGLTAALVYGRRKELTLWPTLDALTPTFAVMSVAIALSHLSSGAAYGAPTNLPWGIELWGATRHPTQIYETMAACLILFITWPGRERIPANRPGESFLNFIALTAGVGVFLYAFRGDSTLIQGGFRLHQILAWVILAGSLWAKRSIQKTSIEEVPDYQ